jgi:hypothetical protein
MRTSVAVLIPVLDRPSRVGPLVDSLTVSENTEAPATPYFLCSPGDDAQIAAVRASGSELFVVDWEPGRGDYAKKMNYGWRHTEEEWVFFAADDVLFRPGWLEACFRVFGETEACVIGTNDLGNRTVMDGRHSTHTLVHRDYAVCGSIDDPTVILHEGYWHNWVDNELVETAKWRGTFASAGDAHVEHLHPFWRKGGDDATYERGRRHFNDDQALFNQRRRLWA